MGRKLSFKDKKATKRIVKFLSLWPDQKVRKLVIKDSPDTVIKAIANAALNAREGDVRLSPTHRRLLRKHQRQIARLTSRKVPISSKRKILQQSGNGFLAILPILLSSVLGSLGSLFLNKKE